jgi:hypothetical protein
MNGRIIHFGPYDGEEINTVVEMDPAYILEAVATVPGHGIGQQAIAKAKLILDSRTEFDHDDWRYVDSLLDINKSTEEY